VISGEGRKEGADVSEPSINRNMGTINEARALMRALGIPKKSGPAGKRGWDGGVQTAGRGV